LDIDAYASLTNLAPLTSDGQPPNLVHSGSTTSAGETTNTSHDSLSTESSVESTASPESESPTDHGTLGNSGSRDLPYGRNLDSILQPPSPVLNRNVIFSRLSNNDFLPIESDSSPRPHSPAPPSTSTAVRQTGEPPLTNSSDLHGNLNVQPEQEHSGAGPSSGPRQRSVRFGGTTKKSHPPPSLSKPPVMPDLKIKSSSCVPRRPRRRSTSKSKHQSPQNI